MVSGKKGTYSLDRNDTVIAGTNLWNTSATNNTVDNTKTHNLLEKLIKATEAGGNVIMGATAVGHVGAMNTFSI
jgi:predicted enzyme related to lactoylglutathione lyase